MVTRSIVLQLLTGLCSEDSRFPTDCFIQNSQLFSQDPQFSLPRLFSMKFHEISWILRPCTADRRWSLSPCETSGDLRVCDESHGFSGSVRVVLPSPQKSFLPENFQKRYCSAFQQIVVYRILLYHCFYVNNGEYYWLDLGGWLIIITVHWISGKVLVACWAVPPVSPRPLALP